MTNRYTGLFFLVIAFAMLAAACGSGTEEVAAEGGESPTTSEATADPLADYPDPTVSHLQQLLNDLGYKAGAVDGLLGDRTVDALRAFQADNGLEQTGHVDIDTLSALADQSDSARATVVESLQTVLAELGYYTDLIDGIPGSRSIEALTAFQAATDLPETGELDGTTFERLISTYRTEVTQAHLGAAAESGRGGDVPAVPRTVPEGASPDEYLQQGDDGPEVQQVQNRLIELGYRPGTPDGEFGAATASAVMAFQKREGLQRDAIVGPDVYDRLASPQGAGPQSTSNGPRVEVDLDRQIMFVVEASGEVTTINVSTGSGRQYQSAEAGKGIVTAHTPTGDFVVQRRIDGDRKAPLGTLYRPLYFDGGWAIHGNPYVPGFPASHGCVRTANADQDFVFDVLRDGDPVWIYGNNPPTPSDADAGF
ncbi:MAG: peptidoglycan-binding protein [Acidimicrobiia bacterium]